MITLQVENVKCGGCANTLKRSLRDEFGNVSVNLDVEPREISLEIDSSQLESLKTKLRKLGYPLSTDELGKIENLEATAKSFVSCSIGKVDNILHGE